MSQIRRRFVWPQLSPSITKIFLGIKNRFSFILVLIIAASLAILSSLLTDNTQKIIFVLIVGLSAIVILIISYIVDLFETGREFGLLRYVPVEIIVHHKLHRVIFNDETNDGKEYEKLNGDKKTYNCAQVQNCWIIQNKMDILYNSYKTTMESNKYVPSHSLITCFINGVNIPLKFRDGEPEYYHVLSYAIEDGEEKHKGIFKDLNFPVHIEPHDFATIETQYPSNAYAEAIAGKEDSYSVQMTHLTEKITIEFILKGKFKSNYTLSESKEYDIDGGIKTFHVLDKSGQRMKKTEDELKELKMKPQYTNSKIKWVVYYPKIGYTYRVFFTIKKKQTS
jgi:hypothetical protein